MLRGMEIHLPASSEPGVDSRADAAAAIKPTSNAPSCSLHVRLLCSDMPGCVARLHPVGVESCNDGTTDVQAWLPSQTFVQIEVTPLEYDESKYEGVCVTRAVLRHMPAQGDHIQLRVLAPLSHKNAAATETGKAIVLRRDTTQAITQYEIGAIPTGPNVKVDQIQLGRDIECYGSGFLLFDATKPDACNALLELSFRMARKNRTDSQAVEFATEQSVTSTIRLMCTQESAAEINCDRGRAMGIRRQWDKKHRPALEAKIDRYRELRDAARKEEAALMQQADALFEDKKQTKAKKQQK